MSDMDIRATLNELDLNDLIAVQRRLGRLNVRPEFRQYWIKQHEYAKELLHDERRGLLIKKMARLLCEITFSLATVPEGGHPNYYQYTDARLLDWYLAPDIAKLSDLKAKSMEGIYFLLRDLLEFETRSLGGFEHNLQEQFDRKTVHWRLDVIQEAVELLQKFSEKPLEEQDIHHLSSLENYVVQWSKLSALLHFSCMPLTQNHDEVVFIRVLHGSELCFFGIRIALTGAIEALKFENPTIAQVELNDGLKFAQILHRLLKILKTMPVEHFAMFRDYTGKASAIQSMSYHLMDIYFRGVNTEKAEHFQKVNQLKVLLRFANPRFISLKQALAQYDEQETKWQEVYAAARSLDRQLLTWRGLHLSFAKVYIPAGGSGTGGTTGASYLRQHLQVGLFDDTEIDWDIVHEIFPELELPGDLRTPSGITVAPTMDLLTTRTNSDEEGSVPQSIDRSKTV